MSKTVLVIAAHADDEVLGCGGAILKHVKAGDSVHLILCADGVSSRPDSRDLDLQNRLSAAKKAHSILGIEDVHYLNFPDNRMDSLGLLDMIQIIEPIVQKIEPSHIYTHSHTDLNVDHRRTHEIVMTICRPQPESLIKEIYGFEVLSSTEWGIDQGSRFDPNLFIDISAELSKKLLALEAYGDEMRTPPHSRSIDHAEILARHRGFSVGLSAAEAFSIYRIIR